MANNRISQEDFIKKAKKAHPNYDFSKVEYKGSGELIIVGCDNPNHGYFSVKASNILRSGCALCAIESKRYNTESFIEKAKIIHPHYDYSDVVYVNSISKVKIGCNKHSVFEMTPGNLLSGQQCAYCAEKKKPTTEEFITKCKESDLIRKDFIYDKVEYIGNKVKISIGCPEHDYFEITPSDLLTGYGCAKCYGNHKYSTDEFIEKAKEIFPDYDYSKVDYNGNKVKVLIGCDIGHGFFETRPYTLLSGHGCRECDRGFGEYFSKIALELIFKVKFEKIRPDWIINPSTNRKLELDGYAYIDYLNLYLAFEYQGMQHEKVIEFFKMTEKDLIYRKGLDQLKRDKCKENSVYLIEIPQFGIMFGPKNFKDFIKQKSIELGFQLPSDFDEIDIDIAKIEKEHKQMKINKFKDKLQTSLIK